MKFPTSSTLLLFLAVLLAAPSLSCGGGDIGPRAYQIESRDQWVGGPAAGACILKLTRRPLTDSGWNGTTGAMATRRILHATVQQV